MPVGGKFQREISLSFYGKQVNKKGLRGADGIDRTPDAGAFAATGPMGENPHPFGIEYTIGKERNI